VGEKMLSTSEELKVGHLCWI